MRSSLIAFILFLSASVAAHADYLYSVQAYNYNGQDLDFSFTEPSLLTATTTIPVADLSFTQLPSSPCSIASYSIESPNSGDVFLIQDYVATNNGCPSSGEVELQGPITQDGVYSNGAQFPTILTITGSPDVAATPEPGSLLLLGSGLLAAVGALRKRLAGDGRSGPVTG